MVPLLIALGDADGLRASEFCHVVEHAHSNDKFGRPGNGTTCPQTLSRQRLVPAHCVRGQRTTVVTASLLPFVSTAPSDGVDRFFQLSFAGRGGRQVNCTFPRWNSGHRAARGDLSATGLHVVCVAAADGIDRFVRRVLRKQFGPRFAVRDILARHECCSPSAGVRGEYEMDLAPSVALRVTVLADLQLAFAVDLHARAVHDQVQQFKHAVSPAAFSHDGTRSFSSAQANPRRPDRSDFAQSLARRARAKGTLFSSRAMPEPVHCRAAACRHGVRHFRKNIVVTRVGMLLRLIWRVSSVVKFPSRHFAFSARVVPLSLACSRAQRSKIHIRTRIVNRIVSRRRGLQALRR